MEVQALIIPWLVSGSAGIALTGIGAFALYQMRTQVIMLGQDLHQRIFNRTGFFWTVNIVFMAVSVLHAGVFFGITGNGHDIPGIAQYLGFAVSFFLDLVTIILMQALLEARYRGEEMQARKFLVFIAICCGTSTFANLAISLNDFDPRVFLPHAPIWVQTASPYVLASFPLFVIMMSIAAEMIINVRPLDSLNEDEYEADEKKRLKLLEIRNTYLQKQADEELRTLTIRSQMRANKQLRKGQLPKSFRWFWEKPLDVDTLITGVTTQLKGLYEPQIEALKKQIEEAKSLQVKPVQEPLDSTVITLAFEDDEEPDSEVMPLTINAVIPDSITTVPSTPDMASYNIDQEMTRLVKDYPLVFSTWIAKGVKSVSLDEIAEITGHSKRRLVRHINKTIVRTPKNANLYTVSSVIKWLKTAPLPQSKSGEMPAIKLQNGHNKDAVNLNEFEVIASSSESE